MLTDILCSDMISLISDILVSCNEFKLLMVNKYLRNLTKPKILQSIQSIVRMKLSFTPLQLHTLCMRVLSFSPVVKLIKSLQKKRLIYYTGNNLKSNTTLVLGQWTFLDHNRILPLNKTRINSVMLDYKKNGTVWDLDLEDIFKRAPDSLLFLSQ